MENSFCKVVGSDRSSASKNVTELQLKACKDKSTKFNYSGSLGGTSDSGYGSSFTTTVAKLHHKIVVACKNGQLEIVKELIAGKNIVWKKCVSQSDHHGDTPLHVAALYGKKIIVKYLVEETDCEVEIRNRYYNTPLHRAANQGNLEIVQYLIEEKKSNPMCECRWKRTPLHNACRHGRFEVINFLLNIPEVDSSVKDSLLQSTPLQLAAEYGTVESVQCMIEHGVGSEESGKYTLLHLAAYGGKLDIVEYLIEKVGYDPMIKDKDDKTPLHSACAGHGYFEVIRYLVDDCKVDKDHHDNRYKESPLCTAAANGKLTALKYLIEEKGCIVEHGNINRDTALHSAAFEGRMDAVKYLIEEVKCGVSCEGRKGRTPLHAACKNNKQNIVEYLMTKKNVNTSARDHTGATALHLAAREGHLPLIKKLINQFRFDHSIKDKNSKTPLAYAQDRGRSATVQYLSRIEEIASGKCTWYEMKE